MHRAPHNLSWYLNLQFIAVAGVSVVIRSRSRPSAACCVVLWPCVGPRTRMSLTAAGPLAGRLPFCVESFGYSTCFAHSHAYGKCSGPCRMRKFDFQIKFHVFALGFLCSGRSLVASGRGDCLFVAAWSVPHLTLRRRVSAAFAPLHLPRFLFEMLCPIVGFDRWLCPSRSFAYWLIGLSHVSGFRLASAVLPHFARGPGHRTLITHVSARFPV